MTTERLVGSAAALTLVIGACGCSLINRFDDYVRPEEGGAAGVGSMAHAGSSSRQDDRPGSGGATLGVAGAGGTSGTRASGVVGSAGTPTAGGAGPGSGGLAGADPGTGGVSALCSLGDVQCNGLVPQQCSELGQWLATRAACAIDCLNGECIACVAGTVRCKDGAVQECDAGTWTVIEVCDNACESAACVDACAEGNYQCNGDVMLQQCIAGEYVDDTQCEFLCSVDECTGECVPDTRRCNPDADNESQSCNAQGLWGETVPCEGGTFCLAGDCKPCSPGTTRCGSSGPQLCTDAGEWVNQGACASPLPVCFDGTCVLCTPGAKQCVDNTVEQCLADGSAWEVLEVCTGDTPACLDSTKACGLCSEGETQCHEGEVQNCDDAGAWLTTETCSGSTPRCVGGACTECDPAANERRCDTTSSFQVCDMVGSWGTATTCSGDTPLCREDLNFACGCEESESRCRNTTVPEVCEGGSWVAQSECTGTLDYCLPETGQCADCVPGNTECQSGIAHECNSSGSWESLNSCAGPNINCGGCDLGEDCGQNSDCMSGACVDGTCAECLPGGGECVGVTPRVCSSDGAWLTQPACGGTTPACLPTTGECVACLSGTRPCGTCDQGYQNCENNVWGGCQNDVIDLLTDNEHCGSCTIACGALQECLQGTCVCSDGNHGCNSTTPPCYADDDVTHCGPSCLNCTLFSGATGCDGVGCVCEDYAFACSTPSSPACGDWDFEAPATTTGWRVGDYSVNSAVEGNLFISTERATTGTHSLAAHVAAPGGPVYTAEFEVQLCPDATAVDLPPIQLSYDIYALSDPGYSFTGALMFVEVTNTRGNGLDCGSGFDSDIATWFTNTCYTSGNGIISYNVIVELDEAWQGTIFIDNLKITPS